VESVNGGYRSVPTIVSDGTILTEPSTADLMKKLGIKTPPTRLSLHPSVYQIDSSNSCCQA